MAEEISGIGHWLYEVSSQHLIWSENIFHIHGLSSESYTPTLETAINAYYPADRQRVIDYMDKAVALGENFEFTFRIVRPTGEIRHVKSKGRCDVNGEGNVDTVFGVFRDVTDEVESVKDIERAELAHSALVESSSDGYWDWYIQEDYEYMSPRFWEMFGYLPEEKPHKPSAWQGMIFEEDLEVALENFDKHINTQGKHPYSQEVRYQHKDGSTVTVLCRGKVIEWDKEGKPLRMIGTHTDITAIKKVEQRLQLVIDGARDGIWDWPDMSKDEEYWSPQWKKLLGYENDEIEAKASTFFSMLHPDDVELAQDAVTAHVEKGIPFDVEYRLKTKSGEFKWFGAKALVSDNADGSKRMTGSITDINDRKLSDIALKEAQNFQKLMFNNNPDLIFVKDKEFKIVSANDAFLSVYPEEQRDKVIGYTTIENYDEEESEAFLYHDKIAFNNGYSETEEAILFPDGQKRVLFTKKVRFKNSDGEEFILGVSRDITGLKSIEEKLKESEERLSVAIKGSASGLWDWDIITDTVIFTPRFREILSYDGDDLLNFPNVYASFEDRLHPDDLERIRSAIEAHLLRKEPYDVEYRLRDKHGEYVWIHAKGQAIWNDGKPTRMAGSIDDITEKRKALDSLIATNQELERFAYMASHDLQEPLRMVVNFTGLLERDYADQLDDRAKKYIDFAADSSRRMQQLINSLLEYARTGDQAQTKEEIDLENVMLNVLSNLTSSIEQSGANIHYSELSTIVANGAQITSLFQNLIGNSIKYRKSSEVPTIEIRSECRADDWLFTIKDNGIGMNQAYANKIFQPFHRLHRNSEYPGTGMGLAICRKIVEGAGGEIWVETELEKGTTFYFTLPR